MAPGYVLGIGQARNTTTAIIILGFYFSAPFTMFMVRDHFRCKDTPRIKAALARPTCKFKLLSFC